MAAKRYNPLSAPNAERWLAEDDAEKLDRVMRSHRRKGLDASKFKLHALVHTIVENQIAMGDDIPVAEAIDRLIAEGLDRHEAIHAVAGKLMEHIWDITHSESQPSDDLHDAYFNAVRQLTAEEWLGS